MLEKGNRANTLHGILLIALFSFAAFYIAGFPIVKRLSFSPLIVGIVLGMLYANSLRNKLPETWVPGIKFCTKQLLRWGIVLYGFRLTLTEVAAVGIPAVAVDLVIVTVTIFGGVLLGRLLKIDRDTALMTSTGSAICGAAAVLGAEPVVKCEALQDRHRRLHGRDFRNPLDVPLSADVPDGAARWTYGHGRGRLHGQYAA